MKNYTITVNGAVYQVSVEEGIRNAAPVAPVMAAPVAAAPVAAPPVAAPVAPAPAATPAPAPAAAPSAAPAGAQGSKQVSSPMPGKILAIKANVGQAVKRGDVILILEAMKMENEIVAPDAGTVASINTAVGDMVESGTLLATLN